MNLVFGHRRTIHEAAFLLHERGTMTGGEVERYITELEREESEGCIAVIEAGDLSVLRHADLNARARLHNAAVRILSYPGLPIASHHHWRMVISWARGETDRRGLPLEWFEARGRLQMVAVDRLVTATIADLRR
ncbi:MAG: hypothetical protein NTY38_11215 [Acidobacteria bacterium]|nr:hypothetical protein [Acidobacteriota bacterium]